MTQIEMEWAKNFPLIVKPLLVQASIAFSIAAIRIVFVVLLVIVISSLFVYLV